MTIWLTYILLIGGIALQVWNITVYWSFLKDSSEDVLSSGDSKDSILSRIALFLLQFFLAGYIFVTFSRKAALLIGVIFFFGALFCTIMIRLVIRLTSTVKRRSINVVKALIKVVEERDSNLNGHSLYVQNVSMAIWRYLPDELQ